MIRWSEGTEDSRLCPVLGQSQPSLNKCRESIFLYIDIGPKYVASMLDVR